MGGGQKKQRIRRVTHDEIAQCVSDALGVDISIQAYQGVISSIEKILYAYQTVKEDGIYGLFPKDPIFKKIDNALASIKAIAPELSILGHLEMEADPDRRRNLSHDEWKKLQKKQESRLNKVNTIMGDLRGLRQWAHELSYPKVHYSYRKREAKGFVSWALWETLDSHIADREVLDKQIGHAVFNLMTLRGIEEKGVGDPAEAIRRRIKRFLERVPPETASRILTYLIQRLQPSQ
ncbi:hypothetical protein MYX64_06030 [Nitrospinae bacterium AH_259_B05_G02_I21]|nr:hypothetical protein [Nitrospinae bacterium AH_259_B05_G02_I21]MDA2931791.1 hypothetical protein [Nitrospinae bacterium AH-259-F20]